MGGYLFVMELFLSILMIRIGWFRLVVYRSFLGVNCRFYYSCQYLNGAKLGNL